jgi:hypothetical protein
VPTPRPAIHKKCTLLLSVLVSHRIEAIDGAYTRLAAARAGVNEAEYAYLPIQCCASYYKSLIARNSIVYTHINSTMGFWMFMSESAVVNGKTVRSRSHFPPAASTKHVAFM